MAERRECVHCGAPFDVNWRADEFHLWCRKTECQRERKRRAQQARRAKAKGAEPSAAAKKTRAGFMRRYRARHAKYRRRERAARKRRRSSAVTEAGSNDAAAKLYVVDDPVFGTQLRAVTAAGRTVIFQVNDRKGPNGAASGADSPLRSLAPGVSAVTEAGSNNARPVAYDGSATAKRRNEAGMDCGFPTG